MTNRSKGKAARCIADAFIVVGGVMILVASSGSSISAQSIASSTPATQLSSGFFEQSQVQWSLKGPGFFADFGGAGVGGATGIGTGAGVGASVGAGAGAAGGPVGGGLRTGFGFAGGGVSGSLGLNMASGSSRSISSGTASVTSLNGAPGSISSQVIRPFVTGITPVIGSNSFGNPSRDNVSSGLFGIQQQKQAAEAHSRAVTARNSKQQAAAESFQRALRAEEAGNLKMARANYRKALKLDQGPLRMQILSRLNARGWL